MFNSLTGIISAKLPQTLYLLNSGIEWDISVPDTSLDVLPPVGSEGKVYVYLQHHEDIMKLYGFATLSERALFFDLLKVEGIGAKAALKILSNSSSKDLINVLDTGDVSKLEKLPGVGKKTAQKMMLALKGKLTLLDEETGSLKKKRSDAISPWNDVINALVDMGYDRHNCEDTVENIMNTQLQGEKETFLLPSGSASRATAEEKLFRIAIVELAK